MSHTQANRRLLIVDDDPALGQMLFWCFDALGYNVSLAQTGDSARALANKQSFEFALLDFQLPDCDGIALGKQLQTRQPTLRTAMMSANPPAGTPADASEFHLKPISIDKIDSWFKASLSTPESGTKQD